MDRLRFGTSGIPISTIPRNHPNGVKQIHRLGLGCLEMEFSRQVRLNPKDVPEIRRLAKELDVVLSSHAPYYINLNSLEQEKIDASIQRALAAARLTHQCGGYSITFHAGYYSNMDTEYVYQRIRHGFEQIVSTLKEENINIWIRPEFTGKVSQWGQLNELIRLSNDVEMVLPNIDFAHVFARYEGKYNTYDKFAYVFDKIGSEIGVHALENFHSHIAGVKYGTKGERGHLILMQSELNYKLNFNS